MGNWILGNWTLGNWALGKWALGLAFASMGVNFIIIKLGDVFHGKSPLFFAVALCLPAVFLGAGSWWRVRSFARTWQVVLCVLIAWVGMLYAFDIAKNRGIMSVSYLTMILPITALIVEHRCWWFCAKAYVLANAFAMALTIWFQYIAHGGDVLRTFHRFGTLLSSDGSMLLSNPNATGGQLALAAVLAFMLYLRSGASHSTAQERPANHDSFSLGWTIFLTLGCILTASRGAFVAWFGGMAVLVFWETRTLRSARLKDFVAISSVLLCSTLFLAAATGFTPWQSLQERFDHKQQVLSACGRTIIWEYAFELWRTDPQYFWIGAGTGVAPEALGKFMGLGVPGDPKAVVGLDAHNAFVEWGLSFGLLGMIAGGCFLVTLWRRAAELDHRDATVNRRAVLLCFALASMTYVTFYLLTFVTAGALILAMVSQTTPEPREERHAGPHWRRESGRQTTPARRVVGGSL